MQREDNFLSKLFIDKFFNNKRVLVIGCGSGQYMDIIAEKAKYVFGIDPDHKAICKGSLENKNPKLEFGYGKAEKLEFRTACFDTIFFPLSFHHVAEDELFAAISEAVRVLRKGGHILFLEPKGFGSFPQAESFFNAGDGDESIQINTANGFINNSYIMKVESTFEAETTFTFESVDDFITSMQPKQNTEKLENYLKQNNFKLVAARKISICVRK